MSSDGQRFGKTIDEIGEGETLTVNESIDHQQVLLYLGMTDDQNPLYSNKRYAQQQGYQAKIVPGMLVTSIITTTVSKILPGPGSQIVNLAINYLKPVYQDENLTFSLTVIKVDKMKEVVTLSVTANEQANRILDAIVMVKPPHQVLNESKVSIGVNANE
ncbi:MaoC/PaaZ C-terminal domain-containing protein [Liquorilactobacillus vini]|uniref:Dehydrogenase n=1 Tax=Liquorilactobacillus vini DSM 20605 TaxID=1133569 RepID=A0A0R2CMT4_9LACO|nr:MaoC/PaaZ C-terminal domain-containing protein [Liquorilactobacillus vini]KRM89771.1 dehydrogenase [Liquorilactobacillus vini DSM 20605]